VPADPEQAAANNRSDASLPLARLGSNKPISLDCRIVAAARLVPRSARLQAIALALMRARSDSGLGIVPCPGFGLAMLDNDVIYEDHRYTRTSLGERSYQGALDVHRRQLIVDAAKHVFENSGLEGTSVRAIAQAAGCTTGAIYPHFRSKEEIYAVVLSGSLSALRLDMSNAMRGTIPPAKALRRGTSAIYKYYDGRPAELALALALFNGDRPKRLGHGLDRELKRQLDDLLALLAEQVRRASRRPFLPMVRIEATALFTYLTGLLVLKHGGRIDVLENNAPILLAHYVKNMVTRLAHKR
jgi:TetR/AcrR family transcriptional regulator